METVPRRPRVRMVGEDGNVFAIIGRVSLALKRDGQRERAREWVRRATACSDYDAVIALVFEYADPI